MTAVFRDVDVLQVGHHGSNNATTQALLDAVTPNVAVINVGRWNYGMPNQPFTTFLYGHPRQSTLDLLQGSISRKRSQPKSVMAGESSKHFHSTTVSKAVYATGWDGTVRVVVKGKDDISVYREHQQGVAAGSVLSASTRIRLMDPSLQRMEKCCRGRKPQTAS